MSSSFIFLAVFQAFSLQAVYTQCVNRVVPNCGQNILPVETYVPVEGILPNQMLVSQAGPLTLPAQYQIMPSPAAIEPVTYAPTVIQDSSVANNLANALQLLVVSNLLRNTLPGSCDPGYYADPYLPLGPIPYGSFY